MIKLKTVFFRKLLFFTCFGLYLRVSVKNLAQKALSREYKITRKKKFPEK